MFIGRAQHGSGLSVFVCIEVTCGLSSLHIENVMDYPEKYCTNF